MKPPKPIAVLVSPVLPLPGRSGRALRAWDWLNELAENHRVHVVLAGAMPGSGGLPPDYPAEGVWPLGESLALPGRFRRAIGLMLPWLALCSRRFIADWPQVMPAPDLNRLAGLRESGPVARIIVFRLYLHDVGQAVARLFPDAAAFLDMDDRESATRLSVAGALLRLGRVRQAVRAASLGLQYGLVARFVRAGYQVAYLSAPDDCRGFSTRLARHVACRPNRISLPANQSPRRTAGPCRLLFVGTLDYAPNEEAVRMLVRRVMPLLRAAGGPSWRLCVVGRHAPRQLADMLRANPDVAFLPDAEDIAACYRGADIALVPLQAGGGTKLKTLEGFAHGLPVIATRHGVRGLGAAAGQHYLAAETPRDFARAITLLADDPALAARIAAAGRCFVGKFAVAA